MMFSRLSVRTILNLVFLTLAVSLCVGLVMQLTSAWQSVSTGKRLMAISEANAVVSKAMQDMRAFQNQVQTAFINRDEAASGVRENRAKSQATLDGALASAKQVSGGDVEKMA